MRLSEEEEEKKKRGEKGREVRRKAGRQGCR